MTAAICLNTLGYSCCDDLEHLRKDSVLNTLHGKMKEHFGIASRTEEAFPSPTAFRKWLHDLGGSPKGLKKLQELPAKTVAYAQERNPQEEATVECDASFVLTTRGEALWNYKGEQANETFNSYWAEHDMMLHSEYRQGNVSPKTDPLGFLQRSLEKLPPGVEKVSLRMDSAGYNMNLLRYCCEGGSPWGVIHFGISVPIYLSYRKEVRKLPEEAWQKLDDISEWAEVNIVPSQFGYSKKDPELRFLALRQKIETPTTTERGEALQKTLDLEIEEREESHPKVKKLHLTTFNGEIYKTFLVVTNKFEEPGDQVIRWQRARCGKSEEVHSVLKSDLAGGHVPTGNFEANAAWWYLSVLSFNIQRLLTHHLLPKGWGRVRQKRLLATIYGTPATLTRHAKQMVLKIGGKIGQMLQEAHWRLFRFHYKLE
ncbi:MAG TPA: hypothetical protein PLA80_13435 [Synergistaceae bacterium]|nr:hypothetical protein [Synergistaceae bacterium]